MSLLHRYWLRFDFTAPFPGAVGLGCGVTAFSAEDALNIVQAEVFQGAPLPPIVEMIHDVDVRTLDQGHVIPNMEEPVSRGVWFPRGYRRGRS
jgi:hypothetical protein